MAVVLDASFQAGQFRETACGETDAKRLRWSARERALPFASPGTWGWPALLFVLGWASPVGAQGRLSEVNEIFNQRLETTCPYQEAVLPAGVGGAKRYLQLGRRRCLLEAVADNGRTALKEEYWLRAGKNGPLPQAGKARYELFTMPDPLGKWGTFHRYGSQMGMSYVEAGNVELHQGFSPVALLALRPDTARAGQTLYVLSRQPDRYGDTLACYELLHAPTDDPWETNSWAMVLHERTTRTSRRWRGNTQVVCSWEADRTARKVTARRYHGAGRGTSYWERTYATAALTDFTEVHYDEWPVGHAQQRTRFFYRRQFRQLGAQQSRDTYTVLSSAGTAESTFRITSDYRKRKL